MKKTDLIKIFDEPISKVYNNNSKYISRELSWLEFNKRVLYQSTRKEIPLIERLNFLSITSSNMDEFIMVRLSSILNRIRKGNYEPELSGMNPQKEYSEVLKGIIKFKNYQNECIQLLVAKLEKQNVQLVRFKDLNKNEQGYISKIFYKDIFPLLTPINYDTTKDFPDLMSKQLNIVVSLEDVKNTNMQVISFISLNENLQKIYEIPSKDTTVKKYILIEEIIYGYLPRIYYGKKITDYGLVKILREADVELSHNTDIYIIDRMRKTLLDRRYGNPIFIDVTSNVSKNLQKILTKIFDINKSQIYENEYSFNYSALTGIDLPDEVYKKFTPQYPSELISEHDMFTAIEKNDILLHHPYDSYDPVIKFLEHAAYDKNTIAIKQTLYRVSSIDSPIINALCKAAENGKQVTVILEIKARFDEDRNISLIDKLKTSGVKLVYGIEELKTHCKFIVIARKTNKGLKLYSALATGNFNDKTAKLYTDITYFTSNFKIGVDVTSIFNMLSGFSEPHNNINKVYFSPYNLKEKLIKCIDNEINNVVKHGKLGIIVIKVNSISDKDMIDKLYEAAKAGVVVVIFCRGICSIKPIYKNMMIKSIVGRFLEHSRIYYFNNNKHEDVFISSADLLTRNLVKRFELLIPIKDNDVKHKLLKILAMYYKDTFNTFGMDSDGKYHKTKGDINIHEIFMEEAIENYKLKSIPKFHK